MTADSGIQQELEEIREGLVYVEWFLVALFCLGLVWFFAWSAWVLSK
jgi:predicted negative regulator of RcsB-dependent stress response